jgi:hypothetical protein
VIDASSAAAPWQVAEVETVNEIMDIVVADRQAFVIGCGGLEVFDLSNPAQPRSLGSPMPFPPGGVPPTPGPGPTPTPEPELDGRSPMQCYYWSDAKWRDGYLNAMTSMQTGFMAFSSYLWRIDVREPARPAGLGALEVPDGGESLSLGDRLAIVGGGSHKVIDQTDANQPRVAANLSDRWRIGEVVAGAGNLAVRSAAYGFEGAIEFIDLSEPRLPIRTGTVALSGTVSATDIALQESTAYAAVQERGVLVIDAADPSAPRLLATVSPIADLRATVVDGSTAYIAEANTRDGAPGALRTFDVRDPSQPTELGRLAGDFGAIAVNGMYVYAGRAEGTGLRVIDVADPAVPHVTSVHATVGPVRQLAVSGVRLLAVAADALYVYDVANPSRPRELGHVDVRIPGPDGYDWPTGTLGLAVLNEVAYVGWSGHLQTFDIRDGSAPRRLSVRQVPSVGLAESGVDLRVATGGDVAIAGRTLVVAGDGTGSWVFSVRAPDGPRLFLPRVLSNSD